MTNSIDSDRATTHERATEHRGCALGAPYGLLTNEAEYPMNVEGAPLFGWWLESECFDIKQAAYQIRLYDAVSDSLVWDSGKVDSGEQTSVPYTGGELKHGYPYTWEVRAWDLSGEPSEFSARAAFATGLANEDWEADWILGVKKISPALTQENNADNGAQQNVSATDKAALYTALTEDNCYWYSRKEVRLKGVAVRAVAYVAGSQDYELYISGERIGRGQTFDYLGETKYQGWDITESVNGREEIAIGILCSYYGGGQGRAITTPGLIAKFIFYYADGSSEQIRTDESWLTHATGYSNLGPRNSEGDEIECCDGGLMLHGWSELGYNTEDWVPVIVHGRHPTKTFYNLEAELGHVHEQEVGCLSVKVLEDGTTVADFGRVIPATIIIHFPDGVAGEVLTIQEGYEIGEDGRIITTKESTQHTNMTYVYIMKDGEQTFRAWSFLGFRYVSVPKEAGRLTAKDFRATIFHAETVTGRESTLKTSDEMINEVFELFKRSGLYSVQNQFVDTPTREKGQFLVDAVNSSASTTSGSYERLATRKAILQFLDSSDRHWSGENVLGMYNAVYPNIEGCRGIPDFSLNLVHLVWRYYMLTADRTLLSFAYPYMKNTADFLTRYTNEATGLVTALPGGGEHRSYSQGIVDSPLGRFGYDWKGTYGGARTTINALGVRVYDLVAKMATELRQSEDAAYYMERAEKLRATMRERLLNDDGIFSDGLTAEGAQSQNASQHASSHAIMADVPLMDELNSPADYIASLGMKQGPMTADILVDALFKSGRGAAAIRLLTNTEDYGWAKLIKEGYTYTWENWQAGSQSHGWGSASLWQMIEYISGVKLLRPGARKIRISPAAGALDSVKSHTATARGAVDISYSGEGRSYQIEINIPPNMTAEVVFPIIEGGEFAEVSGKNGSNKFTAESQVMTVGSGKRSFIFKEGAANK